MAMRPNLFEHPEAERRVYARLRYRNSPLVCNLTRADAGSYERLLRTGRLDLSGSRPVPPGRILLLQLRGPDEACTQTLLAHVASAARRPDGSWLVRCHLAGAAPRQELTRAVA
jgi:hypothetical protein